VRGNQGTNRLALNRHATTLQEQYCDPARPCRKYIK
jgi:hypothetical protein